MMQDYLEQTLDLFIPPHSMNLIQQYRFQQHCSSKCSTYCGSDNQQEIQLSANIRHHFLNPRFSIGEVSRRKQNISMISKILQTSNSQKKQFIFQSFLLFNILDSLLSLKNPFLIIFSIQIIYILNYCNWFLKSKFSDIINIQHMHNLKQSIFLSLILISLLSYSANCQQVIIRQENSSGEKIIADNVFKNGHFITMTEGKGKIEFVAVKDGKIVGLGHKNRMGKFIGKKTKVINLHGKTMMPGIIDAHSHFGKTACSFAQGFNIAPPPFGTITTIPQLLDSVRNYISTNNIQPGETVSGFGYSDIDMIEGRHPTRYELDSVSAVHPIVLVHFSNHIAVANSLGLSLVNYTDTTSIPAGGIADTFANGTLTGVCKQWAAYKLMVKFSPGLVNLTREAIVQTANIYLSCGVTTAQDMIYSELDAVAFQRLGNDFPIDVNGYYWITSPDLSGFQRIMSTYSTQRFHIKGGKFILDGSIQGYTALLTNPYWVPKSMYSSDLSNYTYDSTRSCSTEACGADNFPSPALLQNLFNTMLKMGTDIHVHCNGDASSDHMINALTWARNNTSTPSDSRVVMIHAQTVRDDQLDKMKELEILPSFFPVHLYYWGDKHYKIFLGPERANRMNPVGSALRKGIKVTLHTDSPTVIAGIANGENTFLKLISSAVNRKTKGGRVLDDGTQKISVYEAIKALTINAAWQGREQTRKGSIQVGKLADLIILNENPLFLAPQKLDSLKVLATIKQGIVVYGSYPSRGQQPVQAQNLAL